MRWNGKVIVDISRAFLDTNGAEKHISVIASAPGLKKQEIKGSFSELYEALAADLNFCSRRGLSERFDSTIGAGTVLMPFGGKHQLTPIQSMVHKISVEKGHTDDCSLMAWGYNPWLTEQSPYHGAYLAVFESVCKLIASGAEFKDVYLSFQEYFEKLGKDERRWGKPFSALLGAFEAQMRLEVAAIGGKDSMSGSFEDLDVPPTLVSFAVTTQTADRIISPEFKSAGHKVIRIAPEYGCDGLPDAESQKRVFRRVAELLHSGKAVACYTPGYGGDAEAVMKMCFGNGVGFRFSDALQPQDIFSSDYGAFLLELIGEAEGEALIGVTTDDGAISLGDSSVTLAGLLGRYEEKLEPVYSCNIPDAATPLETFTFRSERQTAPLVRSFRPKVLIPAFPGTNCEYDSAKAMADAGADPEIIVINNLTAEGIERSVERFASALREAQMVFIPGGFSGGDEPDGSGKFITAFFRSAAVKEGVGNLLDRRGGLMCGICNGFQALIKLGLVPYGRIIDTDENCPTLT
ncbi:MAG: phosphoribosylformylglycinamidine synthase subunit PurQ, partial [Lachnospiraceae bacterium]|nr:phosphoribosylformylglycinamidine synthase subunit PurQ [Lachnospiraceae bacterium]